MSSAAGTAAVKSAAEARFSKFMKYVKSKSEPELAESSDEESSLHERGQQWIAQNFGERLVSEVKRHGSVDKFCQEMRFLGCLLQRLAS